MGIDVIELGLIPTPILYHACQTVAQVFAGIIVTASHNPRKITDLK